MRAVIDRPSQPRCADADSQDRAGRRPARRNRPLKRIIVDTTMLITLIGSLATLALGNILFHVVAGSAFSALAAVHVMLNRRWVRSVVRRRHSMAQITRRRAVVDAALALGWAGILATGIASWAGVVTPLAEAHAAAALVLLAATVAHIWFQRQWIAATTRSLSDSPARSIGGPLVAWRSRL